LYSDREATHGEYRLAASAVWTVLRDCSITVHILDPSAIEIADQ
jgi:hypothetical protein